jgi:hypothetical protein
MLHHIELATNFSAGFDRASFKRDIKTVFSCRLSSTGGLGRSHPIPLRHSGACEARALMCDCTSENP